MKKIILSMAVIALISTVAVGVTRAFFSDTKISSGNVFSAGTLSVSLANPSGSLPYSFTNLAPSQTQTVLLNVDNTGSMSVHLKSSIIGTWGDIALLDTMLKVTKVEYNLGAGWNTLIDNSAGISEFCYSNDGTCAGTLISLASSATLQFRLTTLFDSSAGNAYQGKTYTASVTFNAKQLENPSF